MTRLAKVGIGAVYANISVQLMAPFLCAGWPPLGMVKAAVLFGVAAAFAVYFRRGAPSRARGAVAVSVPAAA